MLRLRPPGARMAPLAGILCVLRRRDAPAVLPLRQATPFSVLDRRNERTWILPRRYSERAAEPAKGAGGGDFAEFLLSVWAAHWIGAWRGARGWINARELFALRIAGTAIGACAAWTLGRAYDRVVTPESLVTSGVYRFVRHPIYTGYLLLFAGGLGALGSPVAVAVLLLSAWRFYKPRMASEDKILESQFGHAWRNYAAATPSRLLPFVV